MALSARASEPADARRAGPARHGLPGLFVDTDPSGAVVAPADPGAAGNPAAALRRSGAEGSYLRLFRGAWPRLPIHRDRLYSALHPVSRPPALCRRGCASELSGL